MMPAALTGCGQTVSETTETAPVTLEEPVVADQSEAFLEMAEAHAATFLATAPELSTSLGMTEATASVGYLSRLGQYGFDAHQNARRLNEEFLQDLRGFNRDNLKGTAAITYDVLKNAYETAAQRNSFDFGGATPFGGSLPNSGNAWAITPYMVTQLTGPHLYLQRMLQTEHPITSRADAVAFLARLDEFDRVFGEIVETVGSDAATGIIPPGFAVDGVLASIEGLMDPAPNEHPLVVTFASKLNDVNGLSEEDRNAFVNTAAEKIETVVYPAYGRLSMLLETLRPQAGDDAGVWRLGPAGSKFYEMALKAYGGGDMDGDDVHALGLSEAARITSEMNEILITLDLEDGTVAERMEQIAARPENLHPNTDEGREVLLQSLREQVTAIEKEAPKWFGQLPKTSVEVKRIPVYEQDSSPGGYYSGPSLDGTRPGSYWINLKNTADNPKHSLPTLTYHEAVPGHHFQISLQREIKDMPLLRNMLSYSEYAEGWALYGEKLAEEMGAYANDPYGNLGRLQAELFRAARLVVDTGLHHKRWSREQAIDYMVETTGETRASITREVERYAVIPGQACSYKLGMIRIGKLRDDAQARLGEKFDVRDFHDEVLKLGSVPLPVLEAAIERWVVKTQSS